MLEINNLSFNYSSKKNLFEDLSLSLPSGNIYGLLGKNGAGKSTLLRLISGYLFPTTGEIKAIDFVPRERTPQFLAEVFVVNEEFSLPNITGQQYLKWYAPFYSRFNYELFYSCLNEFQLTTDAKIESFSYGQKKKFLLSFGLATDCKILILDEPTNGLDIPSKSQFRKVVANAIHAERSFVISTHQVRDMENLIDPIIILDEGKIVFYQTYEQIAKKLSVSRVPSIENDEDIIYAESHFGGYTVIKKNTSGEETNINLELLFNTVINSKEKMYETFKS